MQIVSGGGVPPLSPFCNLLALRARIRFPAMRTNYSGKSRRATLVVVLLFTLIGVSLVAPTESRADGPYEVTIQRGIGMKMRDGVTLRADIYRPKADGKFPVILTRTPYDKTRSEER